MEPRKIESSTSTLQAMKKLLTNVKTTARDAGQIGLSYSFSMSIPVITTMIGNLGRKEPEKRGDYLAATPLIITMLQVITLLTVSYLFSILIRGSTKRGESEALQKQIADINTTEPQKKIYHKKLEVINDDISTLLKNGISMAALTLPLPMLTMIFSKEILILCGQEKGIATLASRYLKISALMLVFLLMRMVAEQILIAEKKQGTVMSIALFGFLLWTGIANLLCFGTGGLFQKRGLEVISLSFLGEAIWTATGFLLALKLSKDLKEFSFFSNLKFTRADFNQMKELARDGASMTFAVIGDLIVSFLWTMLAGKLGKRELSAQNFSLFFSFLAMLPMFSIGQITAREVATNKGKGDYAQVVCDIRAGLITQTLFVLPLCIVSSIFPEILTKTVTGDLELEVMAIVKKLLMITTLTAWFDGLVFILLQSLRSIEPKNRMPTLITVASRGLGLVLGAVLAFETDWGIYGLAGGCGLGILIAFLSILIGYWSMLMNSQTLAELIAAKKSPPETSQENYFSKLLGRFGIHLSKPKPSVIIEEITDDKTEEEKPLLRTAGKEEERDKEDDYDDEQPLIENIPNTSRWRCSIV